MLEYTNKIQEIAKKILSEGKVDMVIGFRKGTIPMMSEPCFVTDADGVGELSFDSNCGSNLANYIMDRKEKIGIVAKGCDSRNIVNHIIENKIKREQLYIIGIPCRGMVDRHAVGAALGGEILEAVENADSLVVKGVDGEATYSLVDMLQDNCKTCTHRNPVIVDEMVADKVEEQQDTNPYEDVKKIEALSPEEKTAYFDELLSPCIRCYACRNACPLCYCPTCFVDESRPQWLGKSQDITDVKTFHFLRAYHCSGRCTECGACENACPMGIKVRQLTKKLNMDCLETWGWEAGLTVDARPALDQYNLNDPEEFIK